MVVAVAVHNASRAAKGPTRQPSHEVGRCCLPHHLGDDLHLQLGLQLDFAAACPAPPAQSSPGPRRQHCLQRSFASARRPLGCQAQRACSRQQCHCHQRRHGGPVPLHVPPLSSPEKRRVPQSGRLLGALERKVRQPRCGNSVHNSADEAGLLRGVVGHGPGIGRAQRLEDLNENKQAHDVQARQQRHQCAPDLLSVPGVAGAMKLQYALQDGTGASTEQQRAESWVSSD
mmetsp:Transcript_114323/g.369657  ORF Transcript_114323/g.369657 Transcript_114323/m.369657 type:complete len:230 (+) Transcript_114323:143-832(+)